MLLTTTSVRITPPSVTDGSVPKLTPLTVSTPPDSWAAVTMGVLFGAARMCPAPTPGRCWDLNGSSESQDDAAGELELLQRVLAEPERIAEVSRRCVFDERRLVAHVRADAGLGRQEPLHACAHVQRKLRLGFDRVRGEKGRAESAEGERPPPRVGATELIQDVTVQLPDSHREEIGSSTGRLDFERRFVLRPHHLGGQVRLEE